jgi:hypothetical protein
MNQTIQTIQITQTTQTTNKLIFGFSGKIGSGKNFIAEEVFLPQLFEYFYNLDPTIHVVPYYFSFGDHLKVECLARMPYSNMSRESGMHGFFVEKNQATRDMLQKYGTENGRHVYHEDVWVRAVDTWINIQLSRLDKIKMRTPLNILPIFIISDVRFKNEADYITNNNGILIRVNAPKRSNVRISAEAKNDLQIMEKIKSHLSEISLDDYKFKYTINNDEQTLDELNNYIRDIIELFFSQ